MWEADKKLNWDAPSYSMLLSRTCAWIAYMEVDSGNPW